MEAHFGSDRIEGSNVGLQITNGRSTLHNLPPSSTSLLSVLSIFIIAQIKEKEFLANVLLRTGTVTGLVSVCLLMMYFIIYCIILV